MSLKVFHVLFISISMALALYIAVWGFTNGSPAIAGVAVLGGVALWRYRAKFLEMARRLGLK